MPNTVDVCPVTARDGVLLHTLWDPFAKRKGWTFNFEEEEGTPEASAEGHEGGDEVPDFPMALGGDNRTLSLLCLNFPIRSIKRA